MPPFLVCIHDATPAYARETRAILGDLSPLIGRHVALGVVPNWNGEWHLAAHPDYCRSIRENVEELLLHGYFHERQRGWGPATWLAEGSDEMNGLDARETRHIIERGQSVFIEAFGTAARGFLAPAWQSGHVRATEGSTLGVDYILGFFSLRSWSGRRIPLATWTWDCGRWRWLGHVGHRLGRLSQSLDRGVPALAIHPRDLERGFWPQILRLIEELLEAGYEPSTPAGLLDTMAGSGGASFRAQARSPGGDESRHVVIPSGGPQGRRRGIAVVPKERPAPSVGRMRVPHLPVFDGHPRRLRRLRSE
jgi:uncharacterized protein